MRRRKFITLLGGAAAWPLVARAQQAKHPVVGFLSGAGMPGPFTVRPFLQGLSETGYIDGRNVAIEYLWADGHLDRLEAPATAFVGRQVDVIAPTNSLAALAAKAATPKIPIVFASGADPIQSGLVARLNRPGGNLTGSCYYTVALTAKRLEILLEVVPAKDAVVALLVNPTSSNAVYEAKEVLAAAGALGRKVQVFTASTEGSIDAAFATMVREGVRALLLGNGTFGVYRRQIAELAARHGIPAMYPLRVYVVDGGLMSYGADVAESLRQQGNYVGRILHGEKAADLPVQLPTRFELIVNLKTAKAMGFTIAESFLARADEVIE